MDYCECGARLSVDDREGVCYFCRWPPRTWQRPKGQRTPDPKPAHPGLSIHGLSRKLARMDDGRKGRKGIHLRPSAVLRRGRTGV